jgi:mannosyltransferase OCH1-like enzyme
MQTYRSLMKPFFTKGTSVIPRHVYTCWHTKQLPPLMKQNVERMIRENPEMQIHVYDEEDCRAFISAHFEPDVLHAYDALIPCSYKSDLWRYCVLYILGGIYVDIKYKTVNGFRFVGLTDGEHFVRDADPRNVYTALMVSMPHHPILLQCIQQIVKNVDNKDYGDSPIHPTGPGLLGSFFTQEEKNGMELYHGAQWEINKFYIVYKDRIILEFYDRYREEQKHYQKNKRYIDLWIDKAIYV